jgi:hypothetical protein
MLCILTRFFLPINMYLRILYFLLYNTKKFKKTM